MTTNPGARRIDRRRSNTRAALLRAGQTLFADRAVDGVTIDDIVQAAAVAKGSFYNHFSDKDGLARAIAVQVRAAGEAAVTAANREVADPAERVARALCVFVRDARDHPERYRAQRRLFAGATLIDAPMNRGVRADIENGLRLERFADLPAEVGMLMVMGIVDVAVARVLEEADPASPEAVSRGLAFGLLRGLGVAGAEAQGIAAAASRDIFKDGSKQAQGPTVAPQAVE